MKRLLILVGTLLLCSCASQKAGVALDNALLSLRSYEGEVRRMKTTDEAQRRELELRLLNEQITKDISKLENGQNAEVIRQVINNTLKDFQQFDQSRDARMREFDKGLNHLRISIKLIEGVREYHNKGATLNDIQSLLTGAYEGYVESQPTVPTTVGSTTSGGQTQ